MNNGDRVTYFAETDFRNRRVPFGIKASDRTRHMYVIGKTGMGKSTMLENLAIQDIRNGEGLAFVDPHGATAEKLLSYVPPERINDVIYFAPFDLEYPIAFNIMEDVGYDKRHLVANGLMSAFKKIWVDAWSARMEYILNNCILALLEYPGSTLLSVNRMLVDKNYRKRVVENIGDPSVKAFWTEEFAKYTDRYTQEATPAIQNKIGQFTANPLIRNIVGQQHSSFDIREVMDNKKILIINLSKGRMGEQNANLLGSMLVTKIYLAGMSRANLPDHVLATLPNFYFYVDEFQSFANESFADILSEARKYKLNLTIAHQYIEQMPEEVRAAVFGNVGTMVTFRIGSYDAEIFEKEFAPRFMAQDIVNLGFAQIYLRLMIDGIGSQPFSAITMSPIPKPEYTYEEEILAESRRRYAEKREHVEGQIISWHANTFEQSETNEFPDKKKAYNKFTPYREQEMIPPNFRHGAGGNERRHGSERRNSPSEERFQRKWADARRDDSPRQEGRSGVVYPSFRGRDEERRQTYSRHFELNQKTEDVRPAYESPPQTEETVSLRSLGNKNKNGKYKRENPLKKALADAIREHETEETEEADVILKEKGKASHEEGKNENEQRDGKPENETSEKKVFDTGRNKEVSGDVLEKILKVEKDEGRTRGE